MSFGNAGSCLLTVGDRKGATMSRRSVHRIGFFCIAIIMSAGLCALLLSPRLMAASKTAARQDKSFSLEIYADLMSRTVLDESELADELALDLLRHSKLLPPAVDFCTSLNAGVLSYDPVAFPAWMFRDAELSYVRGVPAYEIRLSLDFNTWETRIEDAASGAVLWKVQPPYDFTMQALVRAIWGDAIFNDALADSVLRAYSPSRLSMRYSLISSADALDYASALSVDMAVASLAAKSSFPGRLRVGGGDTNDWEITGIDLSSSDIEITFTTPTNWVSTNVIDIFSTENLIHYWWDLAGSTNGTNEVTWIDTATSGVETRFYRVADGETDTDSDGATDAHETLAAHSDPDDGDSYPVNISGTITHSNSPQSGTIYIMAVTNESSWDPSLWRRAELTSPGAYTNANVATLHSYWFKAFRDWRANGILDPWEGTGIYSTVSTTVTGALSSIDINLTDPDASIAGFLTYTGRQDGIIRAIASTSDDWSTNNQDTITSFSEEYVIQNLSQTNYYVKAWIDGDDDGIYDDDREASESWTNNPISLTNSIWDIDMTLEDVDADSDDIPDWWEILHFGNTNQAASADYDSDQMPNDYEYAQNFDPTNAADAMQDADSDGYPNVYEYKHESDPWNISDDPGETGGDPDAPTPSVIVVTNGSIQAGLTTATNDYDIVRLDPGTYTGSTNRNLTFPTHPILLIAKEAATNTIIDCLSSNRAITFTSQSNHTALIQITIANGSEADGGGILISNASPLIAACIFTDNAASDDGGAIRCDGDDTAVTIRDCEFSNNSSVDKGGAIYCTDSADDIQVLDCTFNSNTAGDNGGALAVKKADITVRGCVFAENVATNDGGAIHLDENSDTLIEECLIQNNTANADGGGIRCKDRSDAIVNSCDILANTAHDNGGGLFCNDSADPVISNCVFNGNIAWDHGGGLYIKDSDAWVGHSLIISNTATDGAGIGCISSTPTVVTCAIGDNLAFLDGAGIRSKESILTARNLLIVGNRAFGQGGGIHIKGGYGEIENVTVADNISRLTGGGIAITESGVVTGANAVIWGNAPDECETNAILTYSCVTDWTGANMVTNAPLLASGTYHLLTNSPCIDAGTNLTWATNTVDVDGESRIVNTNIDIGCDEWQYGAGSGSTTGGIPMFASSTGGTSSAWSSTGAGGAVGPNETKLGITMCDHSGSTSELYSISFSNSVTNIVLQAPTFGIYYSTNYIFQSGTSYTVRIEHVASNGMSDCYGGAPDYDYTAWVQGLPASTNGGHAEWIFGPGFALHDPDEIFGTHGYGGCTSTFYADGKTATLYVLDLDLDVDTNNDGTIDTNNSGEDEYEQYEPGVIVCKDRHGDSTNLDHLVEMKLAFWPTNLTNVALNLESTSGGSLVKLWADTNKTTEVTLPTNWNFTADSPPTSLWIDGVSTGQVTLDLYFDTTGGVELLRDTIAVYVAPTVSWGPRSRMPPGEMVAVSWQPFAWSGSTWFPGWPTWGGDTNCAWAALDKIQSQGYDVDDFMFLDDTPEDNDFGTCTLTNLKSLRYSPVLVMATHGSSNYFYAVAGTNQAAIDTWRNGEAGTSTDHVCSYPSDIYVACISNSWVTNNWHLPALPPDEDEDLDWMRSITLLDVCFGAEGGSISLLDLVGGRTRLGYPGLDPNTTNNNSRLFGRMNGSLDAGSEGTRRTTGAAYDGWTYASNMVMRGSEWTTLAPAPVAVFPDSPPGNRRGWGCVVFDTYMDDTFASASQALVKVTGACAVSNFRWVDNGSGSFCVGFDFDNPVVGGTQMKAVSEKCLHESGNSGGGSELDGDRISPNGDDKIWGF